MQKCIIGKKLGMTQIFDEKGTFIPVTVIEAGPCIVVQKKSMEIDGYEAIQVGYHEVSDKHINKPQKGHFQKADGANKKYLREFILEDMAAVNVGDLIKADVFAPGEKVDVSGIRKAKATRKHQVKQPFFEGYPGTGRAPPCGFMGANWIHPRVMKGNASRPYGDESVTFRILTSSRSMRKITLIALRGARPAQRRHCLHHRRRQGQKGLTGRDTTFRGYTIQHGRAKSEKSDFRCRVWDCAQQQSHARRRQELSCQQVRYQSTLTRAEVAEAARKPWRQKGTGHARQGSIRAHQWYHSGLRSGPKPRDYAYALNKKVRRLALFFRLLLKTAGGQHIVWMRSKWMLIKPDGFGMLKALEMMARP